MRNAPNRGRRRASAGIKEPEGDEQKYFLVIPLLGPIMWSCYVLRLSPNLDFTETKLEAAIITQIQKFLLELGKVMLSLIASNI